jgi:hypothetical protein
MRSKIARKLPIPGLRRKMKPPIPIPSRNKPAKVFGFLIFFVRFHGSFLLFLGAEQTIDLMRRNFSAFLESFWVFFFPSHIICPPSSPGAGRPRYNWESTGHA